MDKENATILEAAPGLATCPVPTSCPACGLALKLMAFCGRVGKFSPKMGA